MDGKDPAVARRIVVAALRRYRLDHDLTQQQVAQKMDWSTSKVLRIEAGTVKVSTSDLRDLLRTAYEVTADQQNELLELNRVSMQREGWTRYADVYSAEFVKYLGLESDASIIRASELSFVPGLLQTEKYAATIISPTDSVEKRRKRLDARLERQELLSGETGPQMHFLLDESLLHRAIGGSEVLLGQLRHLRALADHPRVRVRILPFSAGLHEGLDGPFSILEFADERLDTTVYLENSRPTFSDTLRENPAETEPYLERFFELEEQALSEQDTRKLIEHQIELLGHNVERSNAEGPERSA